ncbi:MAG: DUF427 domain-containing protein [Candidatus Nanopelagicales bacterium]
MRPKPDAPLPGQESVWRFPRPPAVRPADARVRVVHEGIVVADSLSAVMICETAHAPAYYVPQPDLLAGSVVPNGRSSWCEFKGRAEYGDLHVGAVVVRDAGWWYPDPNPGYVDIRDAVCFYPQKVDLCEVDGEAVTPLAGSFYGDWPTSRFAGPFKGGPGTEGW